MHTDSDIGADPRSILQTDGFMFVGAAQMRTLLESTGSIADWQIFAESWNALASDAYLAATGRHRRRRHAVFAIGVDGTSRRETHQPHYQSLEYNKLHGGIERWFEPIATHIGDSASLRTILRFCANLFGSLAPGDGGWRCEVHQFRIEARRGEPGLPTPEGIHRDGVDYVLVLLVERRNIRSGTTTIHAGDGRLLGSFTLADTFDAALVDDSRVFHGVTPVEALDLEQPAHRDVLVVTLRRAQMLA